MYHKMLDFKDANLFYEFSRQRVDEKAMNLLFELAETRKLKYQFNSMMRGKKINTTEKRKGADFVVNSAVFIARGFGFSKLFIGLSIVAFGTSLPELATSVVAVAKDESDISLGNVVGSNLFNICMVMGTVGLLNPIPIDSSLNRFEFPAMLFLSCLLLIFARSGYKINRSQGLIFILSFFLYVGGSYWMVR